MPVVDLELTGFYMNKGRWLEQLAIVEERRAELANELQEMLGEGVAQASLFGPPRANINLDSKQQVTEAMNRLGIPLPDSTGNWLLLITHRSNCASSPNFLATRVSSRPSTQARIFIALPRPRFLVSNSIKSAKSNVILRSV